MNGTKRGSEEMKVLAINPGGTSTKIAVYRDNELMFKKTLVHSAEDLKGFARVFDEYEYRLNLIMNSLEEESIQLSSLSAVVGRGGLLRPIEGGTYEVNDSMIEDVRNAVNGEHASNLGCVLAKNMADKLNIPAFVVDPVSVDEFEPVARITGLSDIEKASWLHSLNHKAVARKVAQESGSRYEDMNMIIVHLGSGVSIAAHRKGRAIDGGAGRVDGAFSPERSGGLPTYPLIQLCYSGKYTYEEMVAKVSFKGGMYDYLKTKDMQEIERMAGEGDAKADLMLNAFAYQCSKEIGSQAAVLSGEVDCIVITGGIAYSKRIVGDITRRVGFIAPVIVVPGEEELESLSMGAMRVLSGMEKAKEYKS